MSVYRDYCLRYTQEGRYYATISYHSTYNTRQRVRTIAIYTLYYSTLQSIRKLYIYKQIGFTYLLTLSH